MTDERAKIGSRLKAARVYLRLSQQQVADSIEGLSRSAISLIESGQRNITASELKSLAEFYERPMTEFIKLENVSEQTEEANFVARQMTKLSVQDRAEVVRFTQFLTRRQEENES